MAIAIGTSGYAHPEWQDAFYPADLPREDWLRYYSMFLPFVELDSSYFRMPESWRLEQLAQSVPQDFRFAVVAHRTLTNGIESGWAAYAAEFRAALQARVFRDRLAAVLLQFPHRFRYTDENRVYLGELTRELSDLPLVLEFLGPEWDRPAVRAEAERRGIGVAATDAPDQPCTPVRIIPAAGGIAYLRLHGRESAAWRTAADKGAAAGRGSGGQDAAGSAGDEGPRSGYSYSDAELGDWVPKLLDAEKAAPRVYAAFNNRAEGASIRNARSLKALVDAARPRLPAFGEGPA